MGLVNKLRGLYYLDKKVVLIDDLISTGGSVLGAVKATRAAGAEVLGR